MRFRRATETNGRRNRTSRSKSVSSTNLIRARDQCLAELGPEPDLEKDTTHNPVRPQRRLPLNLKRTPPGHRAECRRMEAESAESPVDFILEPPTQESAPEGESPSSTRVDSPTQPSTRTRRRRKPRWSRCQRIRPSFREDGSESETGATAVAVAVPELEPVHEAQPEGAPRDNFAERAQMAMSRLGELPTSNGVHKTRSLPRVMAIANQKGGVARPRPRSTSGGPVGARLSVLVVDLDPQGNATSGGIDTRNFESSMYDVIMRDARSKTASKPTSVQNLFVTPATIDLAGVEIELVSAFSRELKLKRAIDTVVDDFDFVLIDCPPRWGS